MKLTIKGTVYFIMIYQCVLYMLQRRQWHPAPVLLGKICWRRDRLPTSVSMSFSDGSAGKESAYNAGDLGLILVSWVGKIPWRRERLPTPVFWPEEFHRLYSPWGRKESDMTDFHSLTPSSPESSTF